MDESGFTRLALLDTSADNRIYAAGARLISGNGDWFLSRWPASAGIVLCTPACPWNTTYVDYGATSGWVDAMDVRSDGHIVVAGMSGNIARWAQFSPGGTIPVAAGQISFPGNATTGLAVRFAGPNQIVLAGSHFFQGDRNMTLARFEAIPNLTVSVDEPGETRPFIRLAAPTPNPLIGRSTFAFELPRAQPVQLVIHDATGRQVRMLMNERLSAGRHHRIWDGTDDHGRSVAAGVYFARLVAGADHAGTSIVVLR